VRKPLRVVIVIILVEHYKHTYNRTRYSRGVPKGMERKNSKVQRKTAPDSKRFFCVRPLLTSFGREGDGYNTRKGKKSARLYPSS